MQNLIYFLIYVKTFATFAPLPLFLKFLRGASNHPSVTRIELFYILIDKNNPKSLHDCVLEKLSLKDCSDDVPECINTTLKIFKRDFSKRWKQCNRVKQ